MSDGRHLYIHKYESNASILRRVIFYLKSVHFLFLFSIYIETRILSVIIMINTRPTLNTAECHFYLDFVYGRLQ